MATTEPVQEIAGGVFAVDAPFWGFPLTLYFFGGPPWGVVDTGVVTTPAERIAPFLGARGGASALELVLCTHAHVDHVGGNGAVRELAPSVRIAVPAPEVPWAENATRHYLQLYKAAAPGVWDPDEAFERAIVGAFGREAAVDLHLEPGADVRLPDGRSVEVHAAPAHSPAHLVFVDRDSDCAFVGDVLQGAGSFNSETGTRTFPLYSPLRAYHESLDLVAGLGVSTICTAHDGVLRGDAIDAAVAASRRFADDLHELVRETVVAHGRLRLVDVVDTLLERWPGYDRALQIHATAMTHLDELVRTGEAVAGMEDGSIRTWERPA